MEFPLSEEHRMVVDVVRRFVKEDLMPLEKSVLEREATGDRKSTRLNSSHVSESRMPSSA